MTSLPVHSMSTIRLLVLLALLALATAFAGCSRTAQKNSATVVVASGEHYSIYDLESSWHDQHGTARTLATLRGRPRALAMVYTTCTASCPITVAEMKRIAAATPDTVGLVLVSLDPKHDTPERLAQYATELKLDGTRWTLLTAPDDAVRELAATLGVRYRRMSESEVAHGSMITLLDATGAVVHQQAGVDGTDETIRLARVLAR